jgi:hypothetical protein
MSFGNFLGVGFFGEEIQRRGTHVSPLKIGSRAGELCFGGILRFYADLRRELIWGNLDLLFFEVLVVGPRGAVEEEGQLVLLCVFGVNLIGSMGRFCEIY